LAVNTTQETINAIQEMVRESFLCNAKLDRLKSTLSVDWAYNNTANKIHLAISHFFPIELGDALGDTSEGHNQSIIYGDIPIQNKTYSSVSEILNDLSETLIDYQNKLNMCAKISFDNMDLHVFSRMLPLIRKFDKIVEQSILLVDKINLYGTDPSFDSNIETFWLL